VILGFLAAACILGAIAADHWDVVPFWPVLALLAAAAAWNGFWWSKRRRRDHRPASRRRTASGSR
jgi:predicted signal transduction protein with EAL and GGDEF domain